MSIIYNMHFSNKDGLSICIENFCLQNSMSLFQQTDVIDDLCQCSHIHGCKSPEALLSLSLWSGAFYFQMERWTTSPSYPTPAIHSSHTVHTLLRLFPILTCWPSLPKWLKYLYFLKYSLWAEKEMREQKEYFLFNLKGF